MIERFERQMSLSHQDFFRLLPIALKTIDYDIDSNGKIKGCYAGGTIEIIPGEEHKRKIAALELPVLHIHFIFTDIASEAIALFFNHFSRVYQRGGG